MQLLWWWSHRPRPHDVWVPRDAQPGQSDDAHIAVARLLHGVGQRDHGADGDAVGVAGVYGMLLPGALSKPTSMVP
jgi:hypothetical protein